MPTTPKKTRRRTPERIVETALRLFNEFGEPNVTTGLIANDMGISPGNLYYHYRSKDEIVEALFEDFAREIERILAAPAQRVPTVEDIWLYLHMVFEIIWKYRFLYRDLDDILSRNRTVEIKFKQILAHKMKTASTICEGLVASGDMKASKLEIQSLAVNMTVIATYWTSFEFVRNPRQPLDDRAMARGVFQVMSAAAPFLLGKARELFEALAQQYNQ